MDKWSCTMITAETLTRTYGEFVAVDKVSFTIDKGEIVGLLGHNGAGKTTIMKMLTGFLEPSSGTITIDGFNPEDSTATVHKKIGYLPENCPVYPEMRVIEYLDYAAALHAVPAERRSEAIAETIARTGLAEKALQPISTLSRGYRQRLGVAQAIVHHPDILILDEPTNGLDPTQILHMRELIREMAGRATVIISTHILQEVQAVCSRVIIIKNGRKALDADLEDLQRSGGLLLATDADQNRLDTIGAEIMEITEIRKSSADGAINRYEITLGQDADYYDVAARVSEILAADGHRIFELRRQQRTLETIFGEITTGKGRIDS